MLGIFRIIIVSSLFGVISGFFEDKRVPKKKVFDKTSPEYKKMLSGIIQKRYNSEFLTNMAVEKEYKKYLKEKKKDERWERFGEEIG